MAAPQSTPLPPSPQRNEPEDVFIPKSNTWVAAQEQLRTELQAQADFVNDESIEVESNAELAAASKEMALAAGNYAGEWSSLTGAGIKGISVAHNGSYWGLLANIADIPSNEPGISGFWQIITKQLGTAADKDTGTAAGQVPLNSDISNKFVLNLPTLNSAIISTDLISGQSISVKEHSVGNGGGATWDVVLTSSVTPNTYNIVVCTGIPTLSLVIRVEAIIMPSQLGATTAIANNAPAVQAAYDYAAANGLVMFFDKLYPTTATVDLSAANMTVGGVSRGVWRDADTNDITCGLLYTGTGDIVTCSNGSQTWSNFKLRSTDQGNTNGVSFNGVSATLMTLRDMRIQNNGGSGLSFTGDNSGESCLLERVESTKNLGSGLYLARTDTSCNNLVLTKCNFHRNGGDGCNFYSGVQRLLIEGGCDFTLNVGAGVAFRNSVDAECLIANNWFENNDTDILLDCDTSARIVTSKGNKLAEATSQAIYCKNGAINSIGDKFNLNVIGVKFDVSDVASVVIPVAVSSVTTMFSGNTTRLHTSPFQGAVLNKTTFSATNIPASSTNQLIPVAGLAGHNITKLKATDLFYMIIVRTDGVTVTAGTMTINICKNTTTNIHSKLSAILDSSGYELVSDVELFGDNTFSTSNAFNNFFVKCNTDASWDGITGTVDVDVYVIQSPL